MKTPKRLTINELSLIFNVKEITIKKLEKDKQIPSIREKNKIFFDFDAVLAHLRKLERGAA